MINVWENKCENMLLCPHQPIGASVELQHADEMRSSLCMYSITCGAWKSVLGNDRNSRHLSRITDSHCNRLSALNWIEFLSYACLIWQPWPATLKALSFSTFNLHWHACKVVWSPWRRWRVREEVDMRSVRETRVFIFLHTCVFNVLAYIHTGSRTFNICPHYMDS